MMPNQLIIQLFDYRATFLLSGLATTSLKETPSNRVQIFIRLRPLKSIYFYTRS